MSVAGTGIAAGLAQTTHTAQQVSRGRDKSGRDEKAQFQRTMDRVEAINRTANTSDADEQLPDHQAPGYEQPQPQQQQQRPDEPAEPPSADGDTPPYHHIDIQA